jgi:hypothetical protein
MPTLLEWGGILHLEVDICFPPTLKEHVLDPSSFTRRDIHVYAKTLHMCRETLYFFNPFFKMGTSEI